ncbi:MAG TPA: TatD family hydrolase [Anaeromyxobacteraceae bacterium]|jgi:TatD DNase family protein|nr:TatD family hydrolase [Anaeromyxobacteraceae bacterium]
MPRLLDSHAHLDREDYAADRDEVIARAVAAGVRRMVLIGLWRRPGFFGDALELAGARPDLFSATVGVHPHESVDVPEQDWALLERLAADPRVVGVGETGLDFHYDHSPREVQEAAFRRSLRLARAVGKPVVIHLREADEVCARVVAEEGLPAAGGVMHCFTGGWERAAAWLDAGLYLSVAGVVTFKTADDLREAVRRAPRDRVLVETDCPFLAPVPFRGKRNEPAFVARTAEKVAELWGVSVDEVGELTSENARRLFRLP